MRRIAIAVVVAGLAGAVRAQPGSGSGSGSAATIDLPLDINAPQVTVAASPTVVRLGGTFTVFLRATYDADVVVNLREPVELGGGLEVTRKLSEDQRTTDGRTTREWQLAVTAWELGDLQVPPIPVSYTAFGRLGEVRTNALRLRVVGVLGDIADDPKPRDLAPPGDLTARDWTWLWIGLAVGAVIGLATGLLVWRGRRRRRTVRLVGTAVAAPRHLDGPSERALERLLAIERGGQLARDAERKPGYAAMVEVIRDYVGERYRVTTADLTSSELLRRLARAVPPAAYAAIADWLEACDLVKYGGFAASPGDAQRALDAARAVIVETTPAPGAAVAGPAEAAA